MAKPPLAPERNAGARVRCAIYTRKSTEEGLEQEFNSLDAQREACAAYILSQRHEGWTLVPDLYDDGGFSGGSLERPALKQLLADVAAGKIDAIVVYKVDRLTRSLSDFSTIVDVLEKAATSFVSVTQAFNTTTSMGRLMLNVLLSFAQFEREVTGERIRDKVAASKRKGMWMGGLVPLGYALRERKLVPHEDETAIVRLIFERYLELDSVPALADALAAEGIRSKQRTYVDGRTTGGCIMTVGPLAHLLRNPLYVGEVRHKGERYAGEHAGIIDRALWDAVQARLDGNRNNHRSGARATAPSLLCGMLTDGGGRAMMPSHATKGSRRYRYYITRRVIGSAADQAWRIPASELEQLVVTRLAGWLADRAHTSALAGDDPAPIVRAADRLSAALASSTTAARRALLTAIGTTVALAVDQVTITFRLDAMLEQLGSVAHDRSADAPIILIIPATFVRRGHELRLIFLPGDHQAPARLDSKLVRLLARAEQAHATILRDGVPTDRTARAHQVRLARLKLLAPDIVSAILDGRQPVSLTARFLLRAPDLPQRWDDQRRLLGF